MSARSARAAPSGCWPNRQQSLLLRAALLDGAAATAAWQEWSAETALDRLDAGSARLLPLVYENQRRLSGRPHVTPRLKGVHRHAWCRNQRLFQRVAEAVSALEQAGVSTLLLKGVPLAIAYYGCPALRPMADVDVLVRSADVPDAVRILDRIGWRPAASPQSWPPEPLASWALVNGERQELDLHWRVFAESYQSDERLWARAQPLAVHGVMTRTLAPPEQLLHVLVHGIKWNPVPSIRWVADAATVIGRTGAGFEWDELLALADRLQVRLILREGLAYLRSTLDVAVPDQVVRRLAERPPTRGERLELAARMGAGPVAAACRVWCDYRRFAADHQRRPGPRGLWNYLLGIWQIGATRSLRSVVAAKVASRVRHARAARSL